MYKWACTCICVGQRFTHTQTMLGIYQVQTSVTLASHASPRQNVTNVGPPSVTGFEDRDITLHIFNNYVHVHVVYRYIGTRTCI